MFRLNLDKLIEEGRRVQKLETEQKIAQPIKNMITVKQKEDIKDERQTKSTFPR